MAGVIAAQTVGAPAEHATRLPLECRDEIRRLCTSASQSLAACLAGAVTRLSEPCRQAVDDRIGRRPLPAGYREIAFGDDPRQRFDITVPAGGKAPLLMFVHGGGWSIGDKRAGEDERGPWAARQGWAYASVNYRLVPQASVEQQLADIASAIADARQHAVALGIDPDRIVLMGHSAGAHLVAMLGTDTALLDKAGIPLGAIRGIVLLDGAGYDVTRQASADGNIAKPMYEAAFGSDPKRQAALSPINHTAAPNVGAWLILPIERRADSQAQSRALAAALVKAGDHADVIPIPNATHASLNRGIGGEGDYATGLIDHVLADLR